MSRTRVDVHLLWLNSLSATHSNRYKKVSNLKAHLFELSHIYFTSKLYALYTFSQIVRLALSQKIREKHIAGVYDSPQCYSDYAATDCFSRWNEIEIALWTLSGLFLLRNHKLFFWLSVYKLLDYVLPHWFKVAKDVTEPSSHLYMHIYICLRSSIEMFPFPQLQRCLFSQFMTKML